MLGVSVKMGSDFLGVVPWGTHICHFYHDRDDLTEILVPYFKAGLENNEFCLWITASPLDASDALEALRAAMPGMDGCRQKGQLEIVSAADWYRTNGTFDARRAVEGTAEKLKGALVSGYAGLRISGNASWVREEDWPAFLEYETRADREITHSPALAVCSYRLPALDPTRVIDIVSRHQFSIVKRDGRWERLERPEYRDLKKKLQGQEARFWSLVEKTEKERESLSAIFENVGLLVAHLDRRGKVVRLNKAFREATGASSDDEGNGKHLWELFQTPDEENRLAEIFRKLKSAGFPVKFENDLVMKSGASRRIEWTATALPYSEKPSAHCIAVGVDITDRKKAEAALRYSEENYRNIIDNLALGLVILNVKMEVIFANKQIARMFPDLRLHRSHLCLHAPGFSAGPAACSECPLSRALHSHGPHETVLEFPATEEREKRQLRLIASPLADRDEKTVGVIVVVDDITDLKRMEENLRTSRASLRRLSSHLQVLMEHERTKVSREILDKLAPALTALRMDIAWLEKRFSETETVLGQKAKSMSDLLDTTIQMATRISSGLRPGVLDELGLPAAIEWLARQFNERTGIRHEIEIPASAVSLDAPRATALFRILEALLANVAEHADATLVSTSLKQTDGFFVMQVSDNGRGISDRKIKSPKSLGLIAIRESARAWRGTVTIRGVKDKGTTVTVSIPVAEKGNLPGGERVH
jgi:PAS domain S-box-containing protein